MSNPLADIISIVNLSKIPNEELIPYINIAQKAINALTTSLELNTTFLILYDDVSKIPERASHIALMDFKKNAVNIDYHCEYDNLDYYAIFRLRDLLKAALNQLYFIHCHNNDILLASYEFIENPLFIEKLEEPKKKWWEYLL